MYIQLILQILDLQQDVENLMNEITKIVSSIPDKK